MDPVSILLVDDDEETRKFLSLVLEEEGFRVETASSGRDAIDRVLKAKPHMMIVDLALPDVKGDEVCRTIKSDPALKDIIVIMLSGAGDVEAKLNCFASGASEYLVKPIEGRELTARMKGFVRMIDQFRDRIAEPISDKTNPSLPSIEITPKSQSYPTVEIVGSSSDSSVRIRPKYGVYRIESLIGSGAMGHVFKAYDEPLERFVAVKILSKRLSNSPAFVERFRREAKVLAALNHPNIAFIYSFGEEESEHYFAMQWCPGGSVADLIRKKGKIDLLPAIDILLQSAQALQAAWKKGVVHRDIKPSNILFDENQHVKIVDFGLALAEKSSARITNVQEFLGTPGFMAPEQAQSASVDHRADMYSLGITLYCMLYGKTPFKAGSAIEMVIKHASHPFPQYDDLRSTIPRQVYGVIEKMTQKKPEDRYGEYTALIQDLELLRNALLSESQWKIPRAAKIEPVASIHGNDFYGLLVTLYRETGTGVLTARWGPLQKRFLVRQRDILLFESSQQEENIWNLLIQKKLLKKEEMPSNSEGLEASLNRFLLHRTFTMEQFRTSYRELMKVATMQVFFWPVFDGQFSSATIEHDAFTSITVADILLEASRSLLDYSKIKRDAQWEGVLCRTSKFESVLSALNLKPEESFVASRLDGQDMSLHTLCLVTGLPEENIARFVYALEKMGALQFKSVAERTVPRRAPTVTPPRPLVSAAPAVSPPAVSPPPVTAPAPEPPPAEKQAATASGQSKQEDFWMQVMSKRFVDHPERASGSIPKREAADRQQPVRMEVNKTEAKMDIDHHVRVAEQFFELAQEKFSEGDFWKVAQMCKQALKNNPSESKYYHLMATAYAQHPRFGKDAEQCFYKALEMDPWNPDYHLDLAVFYFHNGLSKRAMAECQKALKLAPHHEKAKKLMDKLAGAE